MKYLYTYILISLLLCSSASAASELQTNITLILDKVESSIDAHDLVQKAQERAESELKSGNPKRIVSESIKQVTEGQLTDVKKLAEQVNLNQKQLSLKDLGIEVGSGKLADKSGINISQLLSRYNAKDFLDHENDKLPGLMVFISFSMPENSLKQLAIQIRQAGGVFVLRGIYGSLQQTINAIYELNKQGVSAIIHPELFKKYDVMAVPTFVLDDKENKSCRFDNCTRVFDKLTGNVSLGFALSRLAEEGRNGVTAQRYLERMGE